jgi:hypothetical protein
MSVGDALVRSEMARGPELLKKYFLFSFRTEAGRKAAHEKAMAFLSKA